jgi:hypothetical protein
MTKSLSSNRVKTTGPLSAALVCAMNFVLLLQGRQLCNPTPGLLGNST